MRKLSWIILLLLCSGSAWSQPDTLYSETGKIKAIGTYKEGIRHGAWIIWSKIGEIKMEGNYFQGYRTGLWIYYHSNGIIKEVGNYHVDINDLQPPTVMDLFEEVEKNAIPSDSIDEESLPGFNDEDFGSGEWVFISGNDEEKFRRDGKWLEYDESGVLIKESLYRKGTLINSIDR